MYVHRLLGMAASIFSYEVEKKDGPLAARP